jgi:lipoprotein-anchoring transpeptidase ErfK/SrfK
MVRAAATIVSAIVLVWASARAEAAVVVTVDKTAQRLSVVVDGVARYRWPVSTARWGYSTPNGSYRPQRLARTWFSRKYDMSPMPYSIFFAGGYAIHGSYEISRLGRPASHGCIRLHPANAATLFALVKENVGDTRIVVTGDHPPRIDVRRRVRPMEPIEPGPRMLRPYPDRAPYPSESFEDVFERGQPGPYYGPRYWGGR